MRDQRKREEKRDGPVITLMDYLYVSTFHVRVYTLCRVPIWNKSLSFHDFTKYEYEYEYGYEKEEEYEFENVLQY